MKMKLIILFLTLCFAYSVKAQKTGASREDIKNFYKSKTIVVLEDNPLTEYNAQITDAVKKYWTITPYEFITFSEFEKKRSDPSLSFLFKTQAQFEKDKTKAVYNFITLVMGNKNRSSDLDLMPDLCSFPLSYSSEYEENYAYKIPTIVRFVQRHVQLIDSLPQIDQNVIYKFYNANMLSVADKEFWVVKEDMASEVSSLQKIAAVYKGTVKFVTAEDISTAIEEKLENVVFLHKIGPTKNDYKGRCWKLILGTSDAKLYYFDYHMINGNNPDGFLDKDFKKLKKIH